MFPMMTIAAVSVHPQNFLARILSSTRKLKDVHLAKASPSYLAALAQRPSCHWLSSDCSVSMIKISLGKELIYRWELLYFLRALNLLNFT